MRFAKHVNTKETNQVAKHFSLSGEDRVLIGKGDRLIRESGKSTFAVDKVAILSLCTETYPVGSCMTIAYGPKAGVYLKTFVLESLAKFLSIAECFKSVVHNGIVIEFVVQEECCRNIEPVEFSVRRWSVEIDFGVEIFNVEDNPSGWVKATLIRINKIFIGFEFFRILICCVLPVGSPVFFL